MLSLKITSIFLCVYLLSFQTFAARKELFLFGGGSEPPGVKTIFDPWLVNLNNFKNSSGYQVVSAFDGSHSNTKALNQTLAGTNARSGSLQEIRQQIEKYKQQIRNGSLKQGDQILITIATHGGQMKAPYANHAVAATDGQYNTAELIALRDLAESKGVKLGIIDSSCYSGASLALGTDKTCVLTAANMNVGYENVGLQITSKMKTGKNLEQIFLESRQGPAGLSPGAPQISTEAGKKVFAITQLLEGAQKEKGTFDKDLERGLIVACGTQSAEWYKLTQNIQDAVIGSQLGEKADLEALKAKNMLTTAVDDYNKTRLKAALAYKIKNASPKACLKLLDNKPEVCAPYEIYERNYEVAKARWLNPHVTAQEKKQQLLIEGLRSSKPYQGWLQSIREYEKLRSELYYKALAVNRQERVLYDYLYKTESKKAKSPNPCKDFVL